MIPLVVLLIVNAIVFASWTLPQWRAHRSAAGVSSGFETARQQIEPRLQLARDTYGRVATAEADLATFRERLVTEGAGAGLMALLRDAGATVGVDLEDANFQLGRIDELGVVQLGIRLPVEGTYESVRRLLDELAAIPAFLVIEGVGLSTTEVSQGAAQARSTAPAVRPPLRLELAVSVFLEDPELAAAPAATAAAEPAPDLQDTVQRAVFSDDPEAAAEALANRLASLPPLPVDPEALVVQLDKLDRSYEPQPPTRNLFSIATPPPPPVTEEPEPEPDELELEQFFPVELLGTIQVEGRWHASFSDGIDVFIGTTGERLTNGVEIVEVGSDYAEVAFGDTRTRLTLEGMKP